VLEKGTQVTLQSHDLSPINFEANGAKALHEKFLQAWKSRGEKGLARVLFGIFGLKHFGWAMFFTLEELGRIVASYSLKFILDYILGLEPLSHAFLGVAGMFLTGLSVAYTHHICFFTWTRMGEELRLMLSSTLFQCMTELDPSSRNSIDSGHLNTLLANDTHRFTTDLKFLHSVYMFPIIIPIYIIVFSSIIGWSTLVLFGILCFLLPILFFIAWSAGHYRTKTVKWTDQRTKTVREALLGAELMKIFTWEEPFIERIHHFRKKETDWIRFVLYLRAFANGMLWSGGFLIAIPPLYHLYWRGHSVGTSDFFLYLMLCKSIWWTTSLYANFGCETIAGLLVSINRIEKFITLPKRETSASIESDHSLVSIEGASFRWTSKDKQFDLQEIDVSLDQPSLTMVVGPIGAGKSALVNAIIEEMPCILGELKVSGSIGYAPQVPWIFNASLRENILFNRKFDENWYNLVIEACCLRTDLKLLPQQDLTMIGERGVNLSGGQKARVALARACYGRPNILIADSPLAAVDSKVAKAMFNGVFGSASLLPNSIRIMVSHQVQFLPLADRILVLEEGKIIGDGAYDELKHHDFNKFVPASMEEQSPKIVESPVKQTEDDANEEVQDIIEAEANAAGVVSWGNYYEVVKSSGGMLVWLFVMLFTLAGEGCAIALILILDGVVQAENQDWTWVWFFLVVTYIICTLRAMIFNNRMVAANITLHNNMLKGVMFSPMRFFESNPVGRILNRFTQDQSQIDELLPIFSWDMITCLMGGLITFFLTAPTAPFLLILIFPIAYVLYYVRQIAIQSSREIKRIEASSRSPLYAHFNTTLLGLPTVRAFRGTTTALEQFYNYQNENIQAYLNFEAACRWLGHRVDFTSGAYGGAISLGVVLCYEYNILNVSPALIGVLLTYAIALTGAFAWGVRMSAETENQMTSVERIVEYGKLKPEINIQREPRIDPPQTWPQQGSLKFHKTTCQYREHLNPVLNQLSMDIRPGEKIGICGRTGSGKSTLLRALMRLVNIVEGSISVDDLNTMQVPLQEVRRCFAVIPQSPVLFAGSLRHNLDPFQQSSEDDIWSALEVVQLKSHISDLSMEVAEFGGNFSVGEAQLLCVARAILKKDCKFLLVDEATANVDMQTDEVIQEVLRAQFPEHTVLVIAHRLQTILGCDRVLVLDAGRIAEFDSPAVLAQQDGVFRALLDSSQIKVPFEYLV